MDWPRQQILVVVASIHMQHSEGRSGGGFLNNSSCLGVSRNLSARGNLGRPGIWPVRWGSNLVGLAVSRGTTEKQVNIPALD